MKNKGLKILGLMLVIALVATLFCACDFLNFLNEINAVTISAGSGLVKIDEGTYTANACSSFNLKASWDNSRVGNPSIDWHVVDESGKDSVGAYHGKDYGYAPALADVGKTYTYYATIGEVKSNEIKVTVIEAAVSVPNISCSSHALSNGIVQQKISAGLTDVVLNASWNEKELAEDRNIEVYWLVDGVVQEGEKSKTFTYKVDDMSEECSVLVKIMLFENGVERTSSQVTLSFVSRYALIDSVKLSVQKDWQTIGEAYYVQRDTNVDGGPNSFVTLTCGILPLNANQNADCTYTVTTSRGTMQKEGGLLTTIPLTYGKNIIKASVQNVESRSVIIYYLDYAIDNIPVDVKNAIEGEFMFDGDIHDAYISTQEDMNAFVGYAVSQHLTGIDFNVYLADVSFRTQETFKQMVSIAVAQGVDESGTFKYTLQLLDGKGTITFSAETVFGVPSGAYADKVETTQIKSYVRYSEIEQKRTSLPIDKATEEMDVSNSNDLYRAVSAGYKPVFASVGSGVKLAQLYQKARDVLTTYISDDMSELEKVAVIYDWIVSVVDYDYAVADIKEDTVNYNAFYLEGVFDDHRAVCDGKSKAFVLLCGMEGIKAVRVCGYANEQLQDYIDNNNLSGCGHAWNKVLIDVDGDGAREWYAVDTTWGDVARKSADGVYEYLNYAYFLKTDEELAFTHLERTNAPKTTEQEYNVYQNTYIIVNGKSVSLYIDSIADAKAILTYSKQHGKIAICVYGDEQFLKDCGIAYSGISFGEGQYVVYATGDIWF